jgi:hypothetical protein
MAGRGKPGEKHIPTDATRQTVRLHAMVGSRQETICELLDISKPTLEKHYRKELDTAVEMANASVGGALYRKAMDGDTTAMIFWMKTRARWRETQEIDIKKETTYVFRAPEKITDTQEWLKAYGPKTIDATAEPIPSGSPSLDRKRLS